MSLFAKATKLEAKPTAKAKSDKKEIALAGIETLAEIEAMMKNLEAVKATISGEIKAAGFAEFLNMETNVRPESFKGIDGQATCSVEMRKRSTNSKLNADELAILEALGLEAHKEIVTTKMFGINPVFANDDKLMDKVSKALEKIVPEGFIVLQDEVSKMVVSDELLDAAFKLKDEAKRKTAVEIVTTMALKPKLNADYDMSKLSKKVLAYLEPETVEIDAPVPTEPVQALEAEGVKLVTKRTRKTKVEA